jgi:hypothetical protein
MRGLAARLVALFGRSPLEHELEDEIAAHLEFAAADHRAKVFDLVALLVAAEAGKKAA